MSSPPIAHPAHPQRNQSLQQPPQRTAFVTGATGFLGYEIARQLLAEGMRVRALSRSGALPGALGAGVEILRGGLDDTALLTEAMAGCDLAFHVAADVNMWRRRWAASVQTNVLGTRNMVQAAEATGLRRLIFTSTAGTIGKPLDHRNAEPALIDERSAYNLHALQMIYPHSKWLAEQEVARGLARGLDAVITHPAAVFGPGDWKHNTLPLFTSARSAISLAVPRGTRTICDVRDVAAGHLLAAHKGACGGRYILGGECVTVAQLYEMLAEAVDGRRFRLSLPDPAVRLMGRVMDAVADLLDRPPLLSSEMALQSTLRVRLSSERAQRELGYRSRPARESIRDAAAWFRAQGVL